MRTDNYFLQHLQVRIDVNKCTHYDVYKKGLTSHVLLSLPAVPLPVLCPLLQPWHWHKKVGMGWSELARGIAVLEEEWTWIVYYMICLINLGMQKFGYMGSDKTRWFKSVMKVQVSLIVGVIIYYINCRRTSYTKYS